MAKLKAKKSKANKNQIQENKKEDENVVVLPPVRMSNDPTPRQVKNLLFFSYKADDFIIVINVVVSVVYERL